MSSHSTLTKCRFCSVVSKANQEDPIGSGATYDHFLILEIAQPWKSEIWIEPDPLPPSAIDAFQQAWDAGMSFRPLAIAPDRQYGQGNGIRVLYYSRPALLFAHYEKQEYIVPSERLGNLISTLLHQPNDLENFAPYRQETSHIRELLVCNHGNHDAACGRFGYPIYRQLRQTDTASENPMRVWRCSHFGGHQFAPTLLDLPEGRYWGHLEPDMLDLLIHRKGDVTGLRSFYRGWAGLTKFAQIAERDIWMQEGWNWLNIRKTARILAIDDVNQDWAELCIEFVTPDGCSGQYNARVEAVGQVMTSRWSTFEDEPLEAVKQYRVSHLTKTNR